MKIIKKIKILLSILIFFLISLTACELNNNVPVKINKETLLGTNWIMNFESESDENHWITEYGLLAIISFNKDGTININVDFDPNAKLNEDARANQELALSMLMSGYEDVDLYWYFDVDKLIIEYEFVSISDGNIVNEKDSYEIERNDDSLILLLINTDNIPFFGDLVLVPSV